MRAKLAAFAIAAAITSFSAQAQTESTPDPLPVPAASDAPVVNMQEFCRFQRDERLYPVRALQRGVAGSAVIDCALGQDGQRRECQIVEEQPARMGFGNASLKAACRFPVSSDRTSSPTHQFYERDGVLRLRSQMTWEIRRGLPR